MKRSLYAILLFLWLALPSMADLNGMVINVSPGGEITVNRGLADQVKPGLRWYVYDRDQPKAELEAVLVDNYTTQARIVSGSKVVVGDKATTKAFSAAPAAGQVASQSKSIESTIPKNKPDRRFSTTPRQKEETLESTQENYEKRLSASTKKANFSGGASKMRRSSVNPMLVYNVFSRYTNSATAGITLQNALPTAWSEVSHNKKMKEFNTYGSLDVSVTWWNDNLVDAYSDMMAFREGRTSVDQRLQMRNGLYAQKGTDRFLVFHVKMKNVGKSNVQVAPFNWHCYLLDKEGNYVKPQRYDQILDRTLTPGQETEGSVYFSKQEVAGRNFSGDNVTLVLEDILADRATLEF